MSLVASTAASAPAIAANSWRPTPLDFFAGFAAAAPASTPAAIDAESAALDAVPRGESVSSSSMRASPMSRRRCVASFVEAAPQQLAHARRRRGGQRGPVGLALEDARDQVRHRLALERLAPVRHS